MRLIQLSDIHIGQEGEDTRGVDVRNNFQRILEELAMEEPDALIISGDLCFRNANPNSYQWIRENLEEKDLDYLVLNGNHDDANVLATSFGIRSELQHGELYYTRSLGDWELICLDSGRGVMSDAQYKWLETRLSGTNKNKLVFMHHPPMICGIPFMDSNYGFREMEKIQTIFFNCDRPLDIFCGHYHVDKLLRERNLHLYLTPSTFFQIDEDFRDFEVDHYRIAYRIIDCNESSFSTRLVWMEGKML